MVKSTLRSTDKGFINRQRQINLGTDATKGSSNLPLYKMKCQDCGFEYSSIGASIHWKYCIQCKENEIIAARTKKSMLAEITKSKLVNTGRATGQPTDVIAAADNRNVKLSPLPNVAKRRLREFRKTSLNLLADVDSIREKIFDLFWFSTISEIVLKEFTGSSRMRITVILDFGMRFDEEVYLPSCAFNERHHSGQMAYKINRIRKMVAKSDLPQGKISLNSSRRELIFRVGPESFNLKFEKDRWVITPGSSSAVSEFGNKNPYSLCLFHF